MFSAARRTRRAGGRGPGRVVMAFAGGSRYIPPVQADEWLDAGLRGPVLAEVARCGGGALAGRGFGRMVVEPMRLLDQNLR